MEKNKPKLYIYPVARGHVQDNEAFHRLGDKPQYVNTIPLSLKGIKDHFEVVPPNEAEYFYMGQFSEFYKDIDISEFTYFEGKESKHIADIEGDWKDKERPEWINKCLITINGAKSEYKDLKMFVRPTFSFLLMDLVKNWPGVSVPFNSNLKFGFKGTPDSRGTRKRLKTIIENSNLKSEIILNDKWMASNHPTDQNTISYIKLLLNNTFSLCPHGAGADSVRFYETCFFSRIPIIVSNIFIPFQDEFTDPFYFKIDPNLSDEEILRKLNEIKNTDLGLLKEMSYNARKYFDVCLKPYFEDPTLSFIKWLEKNEY